MKKALLFLFLISFVIAVSSTWTMAQKTVQEMSKEELMELTYDDLLNLEFEQLLFVANTFEMSADELMEFFLNKDVSIASKKSESSFESPLSTTVLTKEEIEASGVTALAEMFRLVPGMIVREKTNGNFDLHIRGNDNVPPNNLLLYSENLTTLVMIDGRIVYNYVNGGVFWETLPIDVHDVERIEIVRGPSSALYGPNATSGIINIITKKPEDKKLRIYAGTQGGYQSKSNTTNPNGIFNASASYGIGKLKFRASGNYQKLNRFQEDIYFWAPMTAKNYANFDSATYAKNPILSMLYPKQNVSQPGYYPISYIDSFNTANNYIVFDPLLKNVRYENYKIKPNSASEYFNPATPALEKGGGNFYTYYDLNKDINFSLSTGFQTSRAMTSCVDDSYVSMAKRATETQYVNFKAKIHDLDFFVNSNNGYIDVYQGSDGLKMGFNVTNANLEYSYTPLANLTIRPGVSYQSASVDDSDYPDKDTIKNGNENLFKGQQDIYAISGMLRVDYAPIKNLRLVAATRADKYDNVKDYDVPYQFVASYKITKDHIIRAVASKSYNSPFLLNSFINFDWQKSPIIPGAFKGIHLNYDGNTEMERTSISMYEVGYKFRVMKNVQIELEGFQSEYEDIQSLNPDSVHVVFNAANPTQSYPDFVHVKYSTMPVVAKQSGVTASVSFMLGQKITCRVFGTYQKTDMSNYYNIGTDKIVSQMTQAIIEKEIVPSLMTTGVPKQTTGGAQYVYPNILVDDENKNSPNIYGGFVVNYEMNNKVNLNLNGYYLDASTLTNKHASFNLSSKVILNLNASYKFWKDCSVFLNLRNLLQDNSQEFAFMDQIGSKYYMGLRLNF